MLKIKYSLFWILVSMQSCLGAEKNLTCFCYKKEANDKEYECKWIKAPTKQVIEDEILKIKKQYPNSEEYHILAAKMWEAINPERGNITTSLENADVDFYTSDKLKEALKKDFDDIGLLSPRYKKSYEEEYTLMEKAFEEYKNSTIDSSTQDDEEEDTPMQETFEAYEQSTIDQNSSNQNLLQNVDKPNFFTVQNSFFPVILLGTLGVAGFLLWLNNKKAPSEDKTPKEKKTKDGT